MHLLHPAGRQQQVEALRVGLRLRKSLPPELHRLHGAPII